MADATEKGASKETPFFIAARKRGFFCAYRAQGIQSQRGSAASFFPR